MSNHFDSLVGLVKDDDSVEHKLQRIINQQQFKKENCLKYSCLTLREIEIIKLIATGNNNLKIANMLFISRYTVEQHRKNINRKLQSKSLPHLIQYALAFDLL